MIYQQLQKNPLRTKLRPLSRVTQKGSAQLSLRTSFLTSTSGLILALTLSFFLPGQASASDGPGAASLGAQAARQAESWYFGLSMGSRGVSYIQGKDKFWIYSSMSNYNLKSGAFRGFGHYEFGGAWRLVDLPWFGAWAGAGLLLSGQAGFTGGLRGLAGAAFHFGDTWFFRPGVNLSIGGALGPWHSAALLTPIDAFVEAGWSYLGFQPFIRSAVGVDPWAGALPTHRAELSIGFTFTWADSTTDKVREKLKLPKPPSSPIGPDSVASHTHPYQEAQPPAFRPVFDR